jgi:outer membrane receptor protein involved in Fe transport
VFVVLEQEEVFASLITRDPDPAVVASLFENSRFNNFLALTPEDVEAIVDFRLNNISVTEVTGLDLNFRGGWETAVGNFGVGLRASYYLKFEDAVSGTAPRRELLDTVNNPVDWRARGELSWSGARWGLSTFVDHVDGYLDNAGDPQRQVPSWTTVDLNLRYDFGDRGAWWSDGATLSASVRNAFDRDPPFVNNQILRMGYDPENADARGRVVALQIAKRW